MSMIRNSLIIVLLTLFISIVCQAQQRAAYFHQNELDGIIKVVSISDNTVVYTNGKIVYKQDARGMVLHKSQLNLSGNVIIKSLIPHNQGVYILYQIITGTGTVQFGVVKLNESLQSVWYRTFSTASGSALAYAIETDSDALYIAGNSCTNGFTLTKLSHSGELIWNKTWQSGSGTLVPGQIWINQFGIHVFCKRYANAQHSLLSCTMNQDGSVIQSTAYALGSSFTIRKVLEFGNKFLILINHNEGSLSSELIEITSTTTNSYLFSMASPLQLHDMAILNQSVFFCGNYLADANQNLNAVLLSCDASINNNWIKELGSEYNNQAGYDDAHSIASLDETLVVCGINADKGYTVSLSDDHQAACQGNTMAPATIQKTMVNSNTINLYPFTTSDYVIQWSNCNSQNLTSETHTFCSYELFTVSALTEISKQTESLLVYPNPANNQIHLNLESCSGTCYWTLMRLDGIIVNSGLFSSDRQTIIPTEHLMNGYYIIHCISGNYVAFAPVIIAH